MPRLLFTKKGNAVWISHLDLMRLFQRAFKRAGLPLTHTQGFNPRPSVSIALPMSVGQDSVCELLDFDLDSKEYINEEIQQRLNTSLVDGIEVLSVYDNGMKIKYLSLLRCELVLEYDSGIPEGAVSSISKLLAQPEVIVEKKNKNGVTMQNIVTMIRHYTITYVNSNVIAINAVICCQNPTLNPVQIIAAIEKYIPQYKPDFVKCSRLEIYTDQETIFR